MLTLGRVKPARGTGIDKGLAGSTRPTRLALAVMGNRVQIGARLCSLALSLRSPTYQGERQVPRLRSIHWPFGLAWLSIFCIISCNLAMSMSPIMLMPLPVGGACSVGAAALASAPRQRAGKGYELLIVPGAWWRLMAAPGFSRGIVFQVLIDKAVVTFLKVCPPVMADLDGVLF